MNNHTIIEYDSSNIKTKKKYSVPQNLITMTQEQLTEYFNSKDKTKLKDNQ